MSIGGFKKFANPPIVVDFIEIPGTPFSGLKMRPKPSIFSVGKNDQKKISLPRVSNFFRGFPFLNPKNGLKKSIFSVPLGIIGKSVRKTWGKWLYRTRIYGVDTFLLKKKTQKIGVARWAKSRVNRGIQKIFESPHCRGFYRNSWYPIFGPKNEAETIDFLGWEK